MSDQEEFTKRHGDADLIEMDGKGNVWAAIYFSPEYKAKEPRRQWAPKTGTKETVGTTENG